MNAGPEKARKRRHPRRGIGTELWISSSEGALLKDVSDADAIGALRQGYASSSIRLS
jgi:hypothetical protein